MAAQPGRGWLWTRHCGATRKQGGPARARHKPTATHARSKRCGGQSGASWRHASPLPLSSWAAASPGPLPPFRDGRRSRLAMISAIRKSPRRRSWDRRRQASSRICVKRAFDDLRLKLYRYAVAGFAASTFATGGRPYARFGRPSFARAFSTEPTGDFSFLASFPCWNAPTPALVKAERPCCSCCHHKPAAHASALCKSEALPVTLLPVSLVQLGRRRRRPQLRRKTHRQRRRRTAFTPTRGLSP